MKIWAAPSPATGSRMIRSRVTSTSSIAHPVTGIDPVTPVVPSVGVSKAPKGAAVAPLDSVLSDTATGPGEFPAPSNANVIAPLAVPAAATVLANETLIVSVAEPVPDAGDTV